MNNCVTVFGLAQYKTNTEAFIVGVEGILRLPIYKVTLYSFLPTAFYFDSDSSYSSIVSCTLAVTDKRIILIENESNTYTGSKQIYSFEFKDLKIKYKKVLGSRLFILDSNNAHLFDFTDHHIIFEVDEEYDKQAERINRILSEYNI